VPQVADFGCVATWRSGEETGTKMGEDVFLISLFSAQKNKNANGWRPY